MIRAPEPSIVPPYAVPHTPPWWLDPSFLVGISIAVLCLSLAAFALMAGVTLLRDQRAGRRKQLLEEND